MKIRCVRFLLSMILILSVSWKMQAQYTYGTTGLLNMPTADMNDNGTIMLGGSYLDKHTSTARWFYDTYGYYVNVTFFSFFEVSYNMELHKGFKNDWGSGQGGYWAPQSYGRFCNQDRQFSVKLRLWKEGWLYDWTPQLCVGSDDISSHSWSDTDKALSIEDLRTNGFNNRYYIALTKHFAIRNAGEVGTHVSYLYNVRSDYSLNSPSFGVDFKLGIPESSAWIKYVNGFDFRLEAYPANGQGYIYNDSAVKQYGLERGLHAGIYDFNVGTEYSYSFVTGHRKTESKPLFSWWNGFRDKMTAAGFGRDTDQNDHTTVDLAVYGELYGFKHPSVGIQIRIH